MSGINKKIISDNAKTKGSQSTLTSALTKATVDVTTPTDIKNKAGDASKYTSSSNLKK